MFELEDERVLLIDLLQRNSDVLVIQLLDQVLHCQLNVLRLPMMWVVNSEVVLLAVG